jgi:hypothetical protein
LVTDGKPALENTTFCTGLWHLRKNSKKDFRQYLRILPDTLSMIAGGKLLAFSDSVEVLDEFEKQAKQFSIAIVPRIVDISALPFYDVTAQMLDSCERMGRFNWLSVMRIQDRGRKIYRREYKVGGAENYRAIMAIWMSKIALISSHGATSNPFATDYTAWIDASVSRFNRKRENWDFAGQRFEPGAMYHYGTKSKYKGRLMRINASFLLAHNDVLPVILRHFEAETRGSLKEAYAHDDETILNRVVIKHPGSFRKLGDMIPV